MTDGQGELTDLEGGIETRTAKLEVGTGKETDEGWGYSPAKPKTEREALGIGLVFRPLVRGMAETHGVKGRRWWRRWQARSKRSMRERGYSPARPKTEREALGIGLVFRPLVRGMAEAHVKGRQWWRRWQAGSRDR
jgi:hypothetical protein